MSVQAIKAVQSWLGVTPDGIFGPLSKDALLTRFTNKKAPALTDEQINTLAERLGVRPSVIRAVRKVEAPRGAFDNEGRPTVLFEKHVFGRNTKYKWNKSNPHLSSVRWEPGTYGPARIQWARPADACALDPYAAFKAASFGAFQILGENARDLGYVSAMAMAWELTRSEFAHLESFERFINHKGLVDELQQIRPGNSQSCIPFVSKYNGAGFRRNNYHVNLAEAVEEFEGA